MTLKDRFFTTVAEIDVYIAGQKPLTYHDGDTLVSGEPLPDFKLDISKLFNRLPE